MSCHVSYTDMGHVSYTDMSHVSYTAMCHVSLKGGKGRTGVMVCCWMLYSGHRSIAIDALELFAFRRSVQYAMGYHDNQTAEAPSQVRYVHYLEAILYNNINPASQPFMLLSAIQLRNCPGRHSEKSAL